MACSHVLHGFQFIVYLKTINNMKNIILMVFLFFTTVAAASDNYTVFIVKGKVEIVDNGHAMPLSESSKINGNTYVIIHPNSYLSLRSSDRKRHTISIKGVYRGKIKSVGKECRQKRTNEFMILTKGKTGSDFSLNGQFYMSGGGYNTRDVFMTEEQEDAINQLVELLQNAGLIYE